MTYVKIEGKKQNRTAIEAATNRRQNHFTAKDAKGAKGKPENAGKEGEGPRPEASS